MDELAQSLTNLTKEGGTEIPPTIWHMCCHLPLEGCERYRLFLRRWRDLYRVRRLLRYRRTLRASVRRRFRGGRLPRHCMVSYRNGVCFFLAVRVRRDRDTAHGAGGLSTGAKCQHQKASEQGYIFHEIFLFSFLDLWSCFW